MWLYIWRHWVESVKRNMNSLRQNSRQHAEKEKKKTACWAITNLHQKWWPWCKRPQSQTVTICLQWTQSHTLWGHTSPMAGTVWKPLAGLLRCLDYFLRTISTLKISDGFIQNYIYGREDSIPNIDPRNVKWYCLGTCFCFLLWSNSHMSYIKFCFPEVLQPLNFLTLMSLKYIV